MSLEPERYELAAPALHRFPVDRRAFFRLLGSGGFVAAAVLRGDAQAQGAGRGSESQSQEVGAWLHIAPDGSVTVFTGKAEVGQDIRTSLTQAVLDELPVVPDEVRLVMGDTDLCPYDRGTFGSRTTPSMSPQLRRVAASPPPGRSPPRGSRITVCPATATCRRSRRC